MPDKLRLLQSTLRIDLTHIAWSAVPKGRLRIIEDAGPKQVTGSDREDLAKTSPTHDYRCRISMAITSPVHLNSSLELLEKSTASMTRANNWKLFKIQQNTKRSWFEATRYGFSYRVSVLHNDRTLYVEGLTPVVKFRRKPVNKGRRLQKMKKDRQWLAGQMTMIAKHLSPDSTPDLVKESEPFAPSKVIRGFSTRYLCEVEAETSVPLWSSGMLHENQIKLFLARNKWIVDRIYYEHGVTRYDVHYRKFTLHIQVFRHERVILLNGSTPVKHFLRTPQLYY